MRYRILEGLLSKLAILRTAEQGKMWTFMGNWCKIRYRVEGPMLPTRIEHVSKGYSEWLIVGFIVFIQHVFCDSGILKL